MAISSRRGQHAEVPTIASPTPQWLGSIHEENHTHPDLQNLHWLVKEDEAVEPLAIKHGILFFKVKIYLSQDSMLIPILLQEIHGSSHEGYFKTLHRLKESSFVFFFLGKKMKETVRKFIRKCDICQHHKIDLRRPAGLLQPLPIPTKIWAEISMDFWTAFQHQKEILHCLEWWTDYRNMAISFPSLTRILLLWLLKYSLTIFSNSMVCPNQFVKGILPLLPYFGKNSSNCKELTIISAPPIIPKRMGGPRS